MKQRIITISNNGRVSVPDNVQMRDFVIAELFGVMMPTVKANIRAILKTGIVTEDLTGGATLVGCNILPDYFGLDMVTAIAFRIQSYKADVFRKWILHKTTVVERQPVVLQYNYQAVCTNERN